MTAVRYRKKPVVIEAMHWDGSAVSATRILHWMLHFDTTGEYHQHLMDGTLIAHPDPYLLIDTLEGRMTASSGDYVIKGVQDEFYSCKPDIFLMTYEPVGES